MSRSVLVNIKGVIGPSHSKLHRKGGTDYVGSLTEDKKLVIMARFVPELNNIQKLLEIAHLRYSTSKSSYHTVAEKENTLVASDYKDPPFVNDSTPEIEYIVRRLTPQECALLQGMPTWWCDGLETEAPTEEEIDWWVDAFEMHRKAMGKSTKPKSRKQVEKWLKNPYSDSAAYKMWGNGIYVRNAWFVLAGIAYYANLEANCERSDTK